MAKRVSVQLPTGVSSSEVASSESEVALLFSESEVQSSSE
jgi:hypothetical protein